MRNIITYPIDNQIIERNYFKLSAFCEYQIKQIKFQIFNCNDKDNHKLVLEEVKINPDYHEELSVVVSPYHIKEDGLYGARIKCEENEWSELTYFQVKAEQGWETLIQVPNLNNTDLTLKDRCSISNIPYFDNNLTFVIFGNKLNNEDGTLYCINKDTFKIEDKICLPNHSKNIKVFFWLNKIFKIEKTNDDKLRIYINSDFTSNYSWELFYEIETIITDDFFFFINNENKLIIVYKNKFRSHKNEIRILHINEKGEGKEYFYLNDLFDYELFSLKDSFYLYDENNKSILVLCAILEGKQKILLKFYESFNSFELIDMKNENYIEYPVHLNNPIYIFKYRRIYWNNKNMKDCSSESWDIDTLSKNKIIPYGGVCNLKNLMDGRLYSIGTKSEFPGMMYLKRYIE